MRSKSINVDQIVSPNNPRPKEFRRNVEKLDVQGSVDKVGGVTYRHDNPQVVLPVSSILHRLFSA